jgi:hypothetical protein
MIFTKPVSAKFILILLGSHKGRPSVVMKQISFFLTWLFALTLAAQTAPPATGEADFTTTNEGAGVRFRAALPPLPPPVPGGKQPFYSWFWEFGDGSYSKEESPLHAYRAPGPREALLTATVHYDDGKSPKKKKRPIETKAGYADAGRNPAPEKPARQAIALKAVREPRPGEELTLVVHYANIGRSAASGRLHLFFNERKFQSRHFQFQEARTHFGETPEQAYSLLDQPESRTSLESALGFLPVGMLIPEGTDGAGLLTTARRQYRDEQAWHFAGLEPGAQRNLFVTLDATASMLRDTSAFIHVQGVFVPADPGLDAESATLEFEIVSSHDPNLIAVSENRVNFRAITRQHLNYLVRFQNNGEKPAEKIELTVRIPEGLNAARMTPLEWYPKCPICPKTPGAIHCLDTAVFKDRLVFTFRNVALPGSNQRGVGDRDSTKGFVRYSIVPDTRMPKYSFRSQAGIVFDQNKPVQTNFTRTRFKAGLSPVFKAGYGFDPAATDKGYWYGGVGFAPYKSYRLHPQMELLVGRKGKTSFPSDTTKTVSTYLDGNNHPVDSATRIIRTHAHRYAVVEIPLLIRKSCTRWLGIGAGISAQIQWDKDDFTQFRQDVVFHQVIDATGAVTSKKEIHDYPAASGTDTAIRTRFAYFADLTLGSARIGPAVGLRVGKVWGTGGRPFAQISLEWRM